MGQVAAVGLGLTTALTAALLWLHPASPTALAWGDLAVGRGRPQIAVRAYDQVAHRHPYPEVRAKALLRSARVWAVELGNSDEARLRYEWALPLPLPTHERAAMLDHLAQILDDAGRHRDAAQRFREACDLDPDSPNAVTRLVRAARAAARGGDRATADRTWRRLAETHPQAAGRAWLGRANLELEQGHTVGALRFYERAVDHGVEASVTAVARLGIATCLERLGDLDEAIGQLDEADLPRSIREHRESSIRARDH
ncbi:MAG: tetratricopeptide repeat protein [Myxococcota bacterium]